jgi:hypothetical protein
LTSRKKRHRARKHVLRQLTDAEDALAGGETALAEKLARRALEAGAVNPRVWLDAGCLLWACGQRRDGEEAVRRAIAIAPTFARAFAELARMQAEAGNAMAARRLMARAVELAPEVDRADLAAELAELGGPPPPEAAVALPPAAEGPQAPPTGRTARYDWEATAAELIAGGAARLEGLFADAECAELASWFSDPSRVVLVQELATAAGEGSRALLREPLAEPLDSLRAEVLPRARALRAARAIALGAGGDSRRAAPEPVPQDAALWRLGGGAATLPRRDAEADALRLVASLGSPEGGALPAATLELVDQRPGRKRHARAFPLAVGDGLVFWGCTRLVRIGGVHGVQPIIHALATGAGPALLLDLIV